MPKPGAFEAVQAKISDICVSMKASDYLTLPEMIVHDVPVQLSPAAAKTYREMERTMVMEVATQGNGEQGTGNRGTGETVEISALTAAGLTNKLLQLCGGNVYDENNTPIHVHNDKLEALLELIEAQNEPILLFYGYRHELEVLREAMKGKRVRTLTDANDVEAWNRGEVDVQLAHPASCAYGLNLQQGGRHIVWYTLTWSLELYQQANARLHRQGQEKPVVVHRLLVQGGVDEDVAKALEGKTATQDALIEALKARIEKVMNT